MSGGLAARPERWRAWAMRPPVAVDVLLAVLVTGLGLLSLGADSVGSPAAHRPDLLGVVLVLLGGLPVALRSRWAVPALAVAAAASLTVFALGYAQVNGGLGALLCLYSVAALRPAVTSAPVACVTAVAVGLTLVLANPGGGVEVDGADVAANLLAVALFWGAGAWARSRARYVRGLEERNAALVSARDAAARAALAEARGAVAREMQDVVGHSVMAMTVQATAARRLVRRDPEGAERALEAVEQLGRCSVQEVRRVLGVLGVDAETAQTRPQPDLGEVPALVEQARAGGLDVELVLACEGLVLEPGAALAAYRVVQEALDNAGRHAGPAKVRVEMRAAGHALVATVEDDGRGAPSWTAGGGDGRDLAPVPVGLLALRERVASYGGSLEACPRRGGGYSVTAVLPAASRGAPVRSAR